MSHTTGSAVKVLSLSSCRFVCAVLPASGSSTHRQNFTRSPELACNDCGSLALCSLRLLPCSFSRSGVDSPLHLPLRIVHSFSNWSRMPAPRRWSSFDGGRSSFLASPFFSPQLAVHCMAIPVSRLFFRCGTILTTLHDAPTAPRSDRASALTPLSLLAWPSPLSNESSSSRPLDPSGLSLLFFRCPEDSRQP